MNHGKIGLLPILFCAITACTTNPSPQQVNQRSQPPVMSRQVETETVNRVPSIGQESYYAIPESSSTTTDSPVSLAPPGSSLQQMSQSQPAPVESQTNEMAAKPMTKVVRSETGITTSLSYAKTWEKVGKALPSIGYPIMEQDSASGTYAVLDKSSTGGLIKRDTPLYQVRVQHDGQGSRITVLNAQNQPVASSVSSKILDGLKQQLH